MEHPFEDRAQAGVSLAERLADLAGLDVLVLGLPRGGVPVAAAVADRLGADLDVLVVQKLGAPAQPELALGAVGAGGALVVNRAILRHTGVDPVQLRARADRIEAELDDRAASLRNGRPAPPVEGRVVVVVDDGIATGATMRVALEIVRASAPALLVAAVPVAPHGLCATLTEIADRVECLRQPKSFGSVGEWYRDFHQLTDQDVRQFLEAAVRARR